jgi:hypothetical protein
VEDLDWRRQIEHRMIEQRQEAPDLDSASMDTDGTKG